MAALLAMLFPLPSRCPPESLLRPATKAVRAAHRTPAGHPSHKLGVAALALEAHWSALSTLCLLPGPNARPQSDDHSEPSHPNATKSRCNSPRKGSSPPSWIWPGRLCREWLGPQPEEGSSHSSATCSLECTRGNMFMCMSPMQPLPILLSSEREPSYLTQEGPGPCPQPLLYRAIFLLPVPWSPQGVNL